MSRMFIVFFFRLRLWSFEICFIIRDSLKKKFFLFKYWTIDLINDGSFWRIVRELVSYLSCEGFKHRRQSSSLSFRWRLSTMIRLSSGFPSTTTITRCRPRDQRLTIAADDDTADNNERRCQQSLLCIYTRCCGVYWYFLILRTIVSRKRFRLLFKDNHG